MLKVYVCSHCKKRFVVMETCTGNLLPIEVDKEIYDEDEVYNKNKHVSHLLNCIPRRMDWNVVRKKLENENLALNDLDTGARSSTKKDI
jgi:hypothetical protein